ncbi:hypothetical protein I6F14_25315 [Bradyrhizobium sp. IC3069]|uniref:hypothetical protein n=1 Tax=unclassified Bradyrhizobium TaxID=2631580 RepID=UPI001CD5D79C|nr:MULTISPECIES: hypothetical protein [unclassified Bradyrhizobium]MCA1363688.1 hypothetical protein [Bradyrhizobium sp. IC4059]MCA1521247.1 hypothetical protein [Bradyrhizobium sp. IC3069]
MDKDDELALRNTLTAAGFSGQLPEFSCLAFSKPDAAGNKAVHAKANEQLLAALLENQPGQCIHITGEMRALADPFHRRLCAELAKRSKTRFIVVYNIQDDYPQLTGINKWAQTWKSKNWTDRLSAINLIGDSIVDVRGNKTLSDIQYSVFGNKYVLLQEKHVDEGGSSTPLVKRVWLLESEGLNEFFSDRATKIAEESKDVPEALFKRFSAKIHGVVAQTILRKLATGDTMSAEQVVDDAMRLFDPEAKTDLDALKAIGFIKDAGDGTLSISAEGDQYLKAIK